MRISTQLLLLATSGIIPPAYATGSATDVGGMPKPGITPLLAAHVTIFREMDFRRPDPTALWDINASGIVVGDFARDRKDSPDHCFLVEAGVATRLHHPGSSDTECQGINRHGAIAGEYIPNGEGLFTGFIYADGAFRRVAPPNAFNTVVYAINDAGVVAGSCFDPDGGHGFIFDGKQYWLFDVPGALVTGGTGINNAGDIVAGALLPDNRYHAYLIHGDRIREIGFPDARDNHGWHISSKGEIGFSWTDARGQQHGGVYDSVRNLAYVVDVPGKTGTAVLGIDDAGRLTGMFQDHRRGADHGFIAARDVPGAAAGR